MHKHALLAPLIDAMVGRLCRCFAGCAVLSALVLVARSLGAQELGTTLLSYDSVAGCPEVADFQRGVERRSSHIHFVDEGSHDRELSIRLSKDGEFTVGELRLIERNGTLRQRSVRFTSCAEAVEGLALITAVSLDPQSSLQSDKPIAPFAAPPLPVTQRPSKPEALLVNPTSDRAPIVAPVARVSQIETALGTEFNAAFKALPARALGGAIFLDVAREVRADQGNERIAGSRVWFSPLVRASFSYAEQRGLIGSGADAHFSLSLATLSACPLRADLGALGIRPCAFGSVGALRASTTKAAEPVTVVRTYLAWGGSAMLLLRLGQTFEIVADTGLGATLLSYRFDLDGAELGTTPALYLSTNLGFRFVIR
jgi:hypothetical protein